MRPENSDTSFASSSDGTESSNVSLHSSSFVDLPKELFQMLTVAGPYLYRDSLLLQKVFQFIQFMASIFGCMYIEVEEIHLLLALVCFSFRMKCLP